MSCEIDNDWGESPECFSAKDRVARKEHQCFECGREIRKGETYRYESGIWDGEPRSYKTCQDCASVRDEFFCSFVFGELWPDLRERISYQDGAMSMEKLERVTPAAREKVIGILDEIFETIVKKETRK